jgi:hypothetical protein
MTTHLEQYSQFILTRCLSVVVGNPGYSLSLSLTASSVASGNSAASRLARLRSSALLPRLASPVPGCRQTPVAASHLRPRPRPGLQLQPHFQSPPGSVLPLPFAMQSARVSAAHGLLSCSWQCCSRRGDSFFGVVWQLPKAATVSWCGSLPAFLPPAPVAAGRVLVRARLAARRHPLGPTRSP